MRQPSRVLVVDDDQAIRTALARLLRAAGLSVDCFESADAVLLEPITTSASCILLDIQLPGLNGLQFQERLIELGCDAPVIFLTGHGTVPVAVRAMKNGARHLFEKPVDGDELLAAITEAIAAHESLRKDGEELQLLRARVQLLTVRQRKVLEQVATGQLNKQIAGTLGISEKTVKVHRARGLQKLGVRSVAQLVRLLQKADATSRPAHSARAADSTRQIAVR
jgi:FixJ family two-component response regulator